jgi:hypothetical protein
VAPAGLIRKLLTERLSREGGSVDDALAELLRDESDADAVWEQVDANIQSGRVRLIFLADHIGAGLRQIIEFLNAQFVRIEVLGVEVRQHRGSDFTALTSSVIGNTAAAAATKGHASRITADDYAAVVETLSPKTRHTVNTLMTWCTDHGGKISYGQGSQRPACYLNWHTKTGDDIWPLIIRLLPSALVVPLDGLRRRAPFDDPHRLDAFVARINAIPGIALDSDRPRPRIPLEMFDDGARLQGLLDGLAWFTTALAGM